jgi:prepilin peptidase CpaA
MHWFLGAAVLIAACAAWVDWRTGHIPNLLTWGALAAGPVANVFYTLAHTGHRLEAAEAGGFSLLGALLCAILPVSLFRANALGGGDAKLFIAMGALLLPRRGLEVELWSFVAASCIAPLQLAWHGKLFLTVTNSAFLIANPLLPKAKRRELDRENVSWFRMGPAILLGTVWTALLHLHD